MDAPLVSIAMPVRNCQSTLGIAIRSILNQTFRQWELLIVEDGSSDETLSIAQSFSDARIRVFSEGLSQGIVARLNQAIDQSRGDYFARMDGDDVAYPDRLMKQVEYIEKHPDVDVLGGQMLIFRENGNAVGRRHYPLQHNEICHSPIDGFQIAHPTFFGKMTLFRRYHYRPVARRCEDQDLLLRAYREHCFANLPDVVHGYREEQIDLVKIAVARRAYSGILFHTFAQQGRIDLALCAITRQSAKLVFDGVAVGTGLNHRLLRQRAVPTTAPERDEWLRVWASAIQASPTIPTPVNKL